MSKKSKRRDRERRELVKVTHILTRLMARMVKHAQQEKNKSESDTAEDSCGPDPDHPCEPGKHKVRVVEPEFLQHLYR